MLDLKPYGAFIENTVRPLLEEFGDLFKEYKGINLTQENILFVTKKVANLHLKVVAIQAIRDVVIAIIIAVVLWTIYP